MKTKQTFRQRNPFTKTKPVACARWLLSCLLCAIFLMACQKNLNDNSSPQNLEDKTVSADAQSAVLRYDAAVATDWYKLQMRFLLKKNSVLAHAAFFGYIGIGLYESVRYVNPRSVSLSEKLYQMPAMPARENDKTYNWQISANAAMASLVRHFYTGIPATDSLSIDSLENAYNKNTQCRNAAEFTRSQAFGRSIAAAIYDWYKTDDIILSNAGYTPPVFPGAWVPTPPAYVNPPVMPYIGSARTYLAEDMTGIAPPFPAAYSEQTNSSYYKIAKELYDISKSLTTEQKNIALYWVDQGDGIAYTPGGHDMLLVTEAIAQTGVHLGKAAEAYAKAGIAERDASIICFRSKYTYTLERPVTYIQKVMEPGWLPFIATPPHPEYPAAHAIVTGSVMQAVSGVLGYHTTVTDSSYMFRGFAPRTFATLFDAGKEAGISRLYGGIHYHTSVNTGLAMARIIGTRAGEIKLHE